MARLIRSIPVLEGKVAEAFVKKADAALLKKGTIDFSKEIETMKAIIKKAKLS